MTLTVETTSGFYYWFENSYFRKFAPDLREIFGIASVMGVDDCCKMWLRSLKGRCHGNRFFFTPHIFCHSDQCAKTFSAVIHDALEV